MNEVFPEIYKKDSTGKIRTWCMELDGNKHRTIAGVQGGNLVTSKWTVAVGKNIGKANETSDDEQALNEIEALYIKKLSVDYHESIDDIQVAKTFKPMLATEYSKRKDKIDWVNDRVLMNPKLDGIRCIATKDGLFSRNGKEIVSSPHIAKELEDFFEMYPEIVLDGELYNHDLKDDFNKIVSLVRKTKPTKNDLTETAQLVEYHIYDIAAGPISEQNYFERSQELDVLFTLRGYPMNKLKLVPTSIVRSEQECEIMHAEYLSEGYEGSMVRLPAPYELGKRSNSLIKYKNFDDQEFRVIGFEEGVGNFVGLPKVILIELPDGSSAKATMTGTRESLAEIKENFDDYINKAATVQFFGWTKDGQLRFPIVKAIHKNKRW